MYLAKALQKVIQERESFLYTFEVRLILEVVIES